MSAVRRKWGEPWTREIFMRFVRIDLSGCWLWLGTRQRQGYGLATDPLRPRKTQSAHRLGYELFVGPIPDGLHMDHLCRNTRCVNPEHVEPVTQAENNRRMGASKTHCKRGHEYTPENTYYANKARTQRRCKACHYLSRGLTPPNQRNAR